MEISSDPNRPRLLTDEEIADILSVIPDIKSAADETSKSSTKSMLATLREQLRSEMITPLAIGDIKDSIAQQYESSLIKPGSAVGINAAEALSQPITQMSLDSKHSSGSSKNVTGGVSRVRELVDASKSPNNPSCTIFFRKNSLSLDEVITDYRPRLTEINVKDLVKGFPDIYSSEDIYQDEPWWYGQYRMLIRNDFESNSVLRLDIDYDMLYAYKITMEDLCNVIENDGSVICVYSPINIGKIDVYPVESSVRAAITDESVISGDNASEVFLWKTVIPALDKLKVSGVSGIKQIYPVEAPVWQIVKEEQQSSDPFIWFLIFNEILMKTKGITVDNLIFLCQTVGMQVVKVHPKYIAVKVENGESPTKLVNRLVEQDKQDEKEYEENRRKEGARTVRRPATDISRAYKIVYADSDGSSYTFGRPKSTLRKLLGRPDVDSTRTYSNNVHEINAVLGLEAARNFLIKELLDVLTVNSYVNPRHPVLLVDYMTSLGEILGVTFTGTSKQGIGALEKASFERAMDTFTEAGGYGENIEVRGTSASIYVGKQALIGTGFSDKFMDAGKYKKITEELENETLTLDPAAFGDAISAMNDMIYGADLDGLKAIEAEMFGGGMPSSVETVIMDGPDMLNDPRANLQISGKLIRSEALEEAALKLNEAPCLPGRPTRTMEISQTVLPSTTGQVTLPIPTTGDMGLPEDLLEQMSEMSISEQVALPPLPADIPVQPVIPSKGKEEGVVQTFDLASFLS